MKWARLFAFLCACLALLLFVVALQHSIVVAKSGGVIVLNQSALSIQGLKQSFGFVHSNGGNYWPESNPWFSYSLHPPGGSLFRYPALVLSPQPPFDRAHRWWVTIPHWLTNLVAWSLFIVLWRTRRKHLKGHCQRCGYDLTGNESGYCPECNAEVVT